MTQEEARRGTLGSRGPFLLRASPQAARWGLLLTTTVTAVALVGTGLSAYLHARTTAASVTRALAIGITFSARQALVASGGTDSEALRAVLTNLEPQGVRYVAVLPDSGDLPREEVGASRPGDTLSAPEPLPMASTFQVSRDGSWVRLVSAMMERGARGPMSGRRGMGLGMGLGAGRERLVLEFESVTASQTVARAALTLTLSCAAAAVLAIAAVFFWRLSRKAENTALQLERDRRLTALGEMSAVLGHELRNPLAALKGHAQLVVEKLPPDHAAYRGAQTVVREAIRLEDLTSNILEFVRSGRVEQDRADPVAIARAAAQATGDDIEVSIEGAIPVWPLDHARIESVLVNLLHNAQQSSPAPRSVELTVRIDGQEHLLFEVRDHGPGIDPADAERIFEPFFTTRAKGTGLGLTLARRIVEEHGGRITAENHPDGGAVFRVSLPSRPAAPVSTSGG